MVDYGAEYTSDFTKDEEYDPYEQFQRRVYSEMLPQTGAIGTRPYERLESAAMRQFDPAFGQWLLSQPEQTGGFAGTMAGTPVEGMAGMASPTFGSWFDERRGRAPRQTAWDPYQSFMNLAGLAGTYGQDVLTPEEEAERVISPFASYLDPASREARAITSYALGGPTRGYLGQLQQGRTQDLINLFNRRRMQEGSDVYGMPAEVYFNWLQNVLPEGYAVGGVPTAPITTTSVGGAPTAPITTTSVGGVPTAPITPEIPDTFGGRDVPQQTIPRVPFTPSEEPTVLGDPGFFGGITQPPVGVSSVTPQPQPIIPGRLPPAVLGDPGFFQSPTPLPMPTPVPTPSPTPLPMQIIPGGPSEGGFGQPPVTVPTPSPTPLPMQIMPGGPSEGGFGQPPVTVPTPSPTPLPMQIMPGGPSEGGFGQPPVTVPRPPDIWSGPYTGGPPDIWSGPYTGGPPDIRSGPYTGGPSEGGFGGTDQIDPFIRPILPPPPGSPSEMWAGREGVPPGVAAPMTENEIYQAWQGSGDDDVAIAALINAGQTPAEARETLGGWNRIMRPARRPPMGRM
jgi:hypothetical protein